MLSIGKREKWDARFQPDVEDGADPEYCQRKGQSGLFLQADYYYGVNPHILVSKGGRENVFSFGLYIGVCFTGGLDFYFDPGSGHVIHPVKEKCE